MKFDIDMPRETSTITVAPTVHRIALPELPVRPHQAVDHANADTAQSATDPHGGVSPVMDHHPLHQVKARLLVSVGEVTVTVGELMAAKEHQVLRLDRTLEHPVDLLLEGQVVARGQLVAVDDHFAVRITELPIALQLSGKA